MEDDVATIIQDSIDSTIGNSSYSQNKARKISKQRDTSISRSVHFPR